MIMYHIIISDHQKYLILTQEKDQLRVALKSLSMETNLRIIKISLASSGRKLPEVLTWITIEFFVFLHQLNALDMFH